MRICRVKATGKIIEMQSDATEGTLIRNAVGAGYAESDIEEKEVTNAEYKLLADAQSEAEKTYSDRRKSEYPPVSDYMDGLVKGDTQQMQGYIDKCLAVK